MTKKIKILFLSFLLNGLACNPVYPKVKCNRSLNPPTSSYVKIFSQVTVLECKEKGKCPLGAFRSTGSGINIKLSKKETTVLTAGHVCASPIDDKILKYSYSVEVEDVSGNMHQAWVVMTSLANSKGSPDMCVLWVPTLEGPAVEFSKNPPKVGDFVYYIGSPAGVFHPPTVPIFSGFYSGNIDPSTSMSTAPAFGGSSGSSLLTGDNKVIGVIWAVHPHFHHVTLSTSYKASKAFLDMARKKINQLNLK